jgi:hypothetical protein
LKRPLVAQGALPTGGLRDLELRYACSDRPQRKSCVKLDVGCPVNCDVREGDDVISDDEGLELSGIEAAWVEG